MPTLAHSEPNASDAVFGRGGSNNKLRENSLLRKCVQARWQEYTKIDSRASKMKRDFIWETLIDPILAQGGRFLRMGSSKSGEHKGQWYELNMDDPVDAKEIEKKLQQMFRDQKKANTSSISWETIAVRRSEAKEAVAASKASKEPPFEQDVIKTAELVATTAALVPELVHPGKNILEERSRQPDGEISIVSLLSEAEFAQDSDDDGSLIFPEACNVAPIQDIETALRALERESFSDESMLRLVKHNANELARSEVEHMVNAEIQHMAALGFSIPEPTPASKMNWSAGSYLFM